MKLPQRHGIYKISNAFPAIKRLKLHSLNWASSLTTHSVVLVYRRIRYLWSPMSEANICEVNETFRSLVIVPCCAMHILTVAHSAWKLVQICRFWQINRQIMFIYMTVCWAIPQQWIDYYYNRITQMCGSRNYPVRDTGKWKGSAWVGVQGMEMFPRLCIAVRTGYSLD